MVDSQFIAPGISLTISGRQVIAAAVAPYRRGDDTASLLMTADMPRRGLLEAELRKKSEKNV
jgi:hypothetical protein